jgi:hypothetical protein
MFRHQFSDQNIFGFGPHSPPVGHFFKLSLAIWLWHVSLFTSGIFMSFGDEIFDWFEWWRDMIAIPSELLSEGRFAP